MCFALLNLGAGGLWLAAALTAPLEELGVFQPNFAKPLVVDKLLGVGASASVFAAKYDGNVKYSYTLF